MQNDIDESLGLPECLGNSLLKTYPQSCNRYEAIGGTVYITNLEKDESIELCQDCSLGFARKSRLECWPVELSVVA